MKIKSFFSPRLLPAIAAAGFFSAAAAAVDLDLLVDHDITEVGADGVTRSIRFQERVFRRNNMVWIERVIPAGAHEDKEHAQGGHEHKHLDLAAAARWIALEGGKTLNVRLVNAHDKVVVNVPAAEYGNIGFDGSWDNAWHLLDPRQLKAMTPAADQAATGMRWYETASGGNIVRVLWDENAEIPRSVQSGNSTGTTRRLMSVKNIAAPENAPWTNLGGYRQKEYSDYLD